MSQWSARMGRIVGPWRGDGGRNRCPSIMMVLSSSWEELELELELVSERLELLLLTSGDISPSSTTKQSSGIFSTLGISNSV